MKIKLFLICLLSFITTLTSVTGNTRVTHGEACSRVNRCDSRASLTCKNGTCKCIMEETMTFDSRYGRCSVLAGEKCIFTAVESESRVEGRTWREEMPCVPNAQCQEGFCTCFAGFYETSNGTCSVKKGHREECETETACRDDQFLICTPQKICGCHNKTSTFEFSRQICVRKAGAACADLQFCVPNAYCREPRSSLYPSGVICECQEGYFGNVDGVCEPKKGYGEVCLNNDYCSNDYHVNLVCNDDGRCGCEANISIFDTSSNMCRRLAGASCHGYPYCIENSECGRSRNYEQEADVVCECSSGYFETKNGTCEPQRVYGEVCEKDDNCQNGLKCSKETGLCQCDTTKSVYDAVKLKCVGLANSVCDDSENCITNSECGWARDDVRRCACRNGYASSKNGSCLASHDMPCSDSWTHACNSERGLVCKEGKCACKYSKFQAFNKELQKCVSSSSGPCSKNIPCVENSHCAPDKIDRGGLKRCTCNAGFVEVDGECQLTIGQKCNYTDSNTQLKIKCDSFAPLLCIEGICQCDSMQIYDRDTLKCKSLVGAACFKDDGVGCVEGAQCDHHRFVIFPLRGICRCQVGWTASSTGHCFQGNGNLTEEAFV